MAASSYKHFKKLLLLGDNGVGKTSLLLRFVDIPIGIDLSVKTIEMADEEWTKLQICDMTNNQQQRLSKRITKACYDEAANGNLLVYDVTNEFSFEHVRDWFRRNIFYSCSENVKTILVGNKADMEDDDESKRAAPRARSRSSTCGCVRHHVLGNKCEEEQEC